MSPEDKEARLKTLWFAAYCKAKGASLILKKFGDLNQNLYLYGTSKKLEDIQNDQNERKWFIILPDNKFKSYWNIVIICLLLYTAIWAPYKIAFIDDTSDFEFVFDIIVDSLFFIDVILSFISAYEDKEKNIECRPR